MGIIVPETCWASNKIFNKNHLLHLVVILFPHIGQDNISLPLKLGPICCPETSVINYLYNLRNIPEERRSYLLLDGSLQSRQIVINHPSQHKTSHLHKDKTWTTKLLLLTWLFTLEQQEVLESSRNVMAHDDAREGKWRGNWRMNWVPSTLHTTSEHVVSSIRLQLKCDGTRWRTGGKVKGKLANGVGSQYSSHYLGTCCIQH